MYQIKLRKEQIVKNFNYFFGHDQTTYMSIFPKVSMEEYWPYIKHTLNQDNIVIGDMKYIFPTHDDKINEFTHLISYTIVFEFPDEETAFYFQLKYC